MWELEVLRLEGARYTLLVTHSGPSHVRAEPFEAFELELPFLWGCVAQGVDHALVAHGFLHPHSFWERPCVLRGAPIH